MDLKLIVILCTVLGFMWKVCLLLLDRRSLTLPVPAGVADVYDPKEYQKWRAYKGERNRIHFISDTVSFAVLVALIAFDAFPAFDSLFSGSDLVKLWSVVLLTTLVSVVTEIPFDAWNTFVIEAKYGFNRSTVRTFIGDKIKEQLISALFTGFLASLLCKIHQSMGDWLILLFAGAIVAISLIITALAPVFTRLFNKFTPLEEGELKEKLTALMEAHGYKVRAIEVMDASRRSTKANAYFTGMGPTKTIVLYDTLIATSTPQEICAVFAHEMGHGLHHDMLKNRLLSILSALVMATAAWFTVRTGALYTALGFTSLNYGMALVLMGVLLDIISPLMNGVSAFVSRKAEYAADAQAVSEGYGPALITGLRTLSKSNMADLSPDPLLVKLTYSHPTLDQRITAIRQRMADRQAQ